MPKYPKRCPLLSIDFLVLLTNIESPENHKIYNSWQSSLPAASLVKHSEEVVGHRMWKEVDLNRLFFSFLGGGGLFWWQNGKHFCRQEKFLVRRFPNVKHFCERKKENNRDNPSTFQCTITFSGRHIFSRTYIICKLFHMTIEGICWNWNWFAIPCICHLNQN